MKKLSTLTTTVALFALSVLPVLAQDRFGLNYGTELGLGTKDLRAGIMGVINVFLGFLGVIAVVIILYGGFVWMTAAGNEESVGKAKKIIVAGIIGLIIIFISYAIAVFVIRELMDATGATNSTI